MTLTEILWIHVYVRNPGCKLWYQEVDRAMDISGHSIAVVFKEDVLRALVHVSGGVWRLPVDSYEQEGDITVLC